MRSSLNTLRMDIFLNSAILNPFVLLFILHDCREEGLLEDLQSPPQGAKMGAVGTGPGEKPWRSHLPSF